MKSRVLLTIIVALAAILLGFGFDVVNAQIPTSISTPGVSATATPEPIRVDLYLQRQYQMPDSLEVPVPEPLSLTSGNTPQILSARLVYSVSHPIRGWVRIQAMTSWRGFRIDLVEWQGGGEVSVSWFLFHQLCPGLTALWCELTFSQHGEVQEYCTDAWQGEQTGENLAFIGDEVVMEVVGLAGNPTASFLVSFPRHLTLWVFPDQAPTPTISPTLSYSIYLPSIMRGKISIPTETATPTPTVTITPTPTFTETPTNTPTCTPIPTANPTSTPTASPMWNPVYKPVEVTQFEFSRHYNKDLKESVVIDSRGERWAEIKYRLQGDLLQPLHGWRFGLENFYVTFFMGVGSHILEFEILDMEGNRIDDHARGLFEVVHYPCRFGYTNTIDVPAEIHPPSEFRLRVRYFIPLGSGTNSRIWLLPAQIPLFRY